VLLRTDRSRYGLHDGSGGNLDRLPIAGRSHSQEREPGDRPQEQQQRFLSSAESYGRQSQDGLGISSGIHGEWLSISVAAILFLQASRGASVDNLNDNAVHRDPWRSQAQRPFVGIPGGTSSEQEKG
jgi:hypothetical protein